MPTFYPAVSGDDGSFNSDGNQIILGQTYLQMGDFVYEFSISRDLFVRFPNITIPKDTNIETAYVKFTCRNERLDTQCNLNCHFNDLDDAIAPVTGAEAIALALTDPLAWNDLPPWEISVPYYSPELKTLLQQIVNRPGWVEGNAAMIVFKNNASDWHAWREPSSIDYLGGIEKPELHVTVPTPPAPSQPSHLTLMGIGI